MTDEFGNRMKMYESKEISNKLDSSKPIIVRIDGKNFSKYTKRLAKPYDETFSHLMIDVTKFLVKETNAKIGYTQSDEITLVLYSNDPEKEVFFDGKTQKLISVISSLATAKFNQLANNKLSTKLVPEFATFDCRVFQVPDKIEAANALLWRTIDAKKNSISMATRAHYSASEMHLKNSLEKLEMLLDKGVDWNLFPAFFKFGSFVATRLVDKEFTAEELDRIPKEHIPKLPVRRKSVIDLDLYDFSEIENKIGIIFGD